jgi:hypothetical protein
LRSADSFGARVHTCHASLGSAMKDFDLVLNFGPIQKENKGIASFQANLIFVTLI